MPIFSETGERLVDFSFYGNSKIADGISCSKANNSIVSNLEILCSSYQKWIDTQSFNLQKLDSIYLETATNNLSICSHALERMKKGVRQLKENANLMKAFRLANYAMFLQQIRKKKRDKDNNLLESLI